MIVEAAFLVAGVSVGGVAVQRILSLTADLLARCTLNREAASEPDDGSFHRHLVQRICAINIIESDEERRFAAHAANCSLYS